MNEVDRARTTRILLGLSFTANMMEIVGGLTCK
jgi:hypothetical protein